MKRAVVVLAVVVCSLASASYAQKPRAIAGEAVQTAGNGIYQIKVETDPAVATAGAWTAVTGASHPAGPNLNVIYQLGTSNTILRSYSANRTYIIGSGPACPTRVQLPAPAVQTLQFGGKDVGFRLTWSIAASAPDPAIELVQEVLVVGPVNGSETIDDTVIRETHIVRNRGGGAFSFGLRKQWDWQIGFDDGPYFGSCDSPQVGCDRSMNMTAGGSTPYPSTYVINQSPAISGCPNGVTPLGGSCTPPAPYLVAGTVAPPSSLVPPPTAPELLQFGSWSALKGDCWLPPLADAALCGAQGSPGDDTSVAYFYGATQATAITLANGEERSFTQYVAAATDRCPSIVAEPPSDPCCPPWNEQKLEDMLFYKGTGGIADPYTLEFHPTPTLDAQMGAYINYLHAVNPAINAITIHFRLNDAGTGNTATGGPQVSGDHWVTWAAGPNPTAQPSPNFFSSATELMQINRWYRVHTGIYLENGQRFFPDTCANNDVDVRIQVVPHALRPLIEMRKSNGRKVERPLVDVR